MPTKKQELIRQIADNKELSDKYLKPLSKNPNAGSIWPAVKDLYVRDRKKLTQDWKDIDAGRKTPKSPLASPSQFRKGGRVKKTGWAKVHRGERVLPKRRSSGKSR